MAAWIGLNIQIGNDADGVGNQSGNGNGGIVGFNTQIGNDTTGNFSLTGNGNGGSVGISIQVDNYDRWRLQRLR